MFQQWFANDDHLAGDNATVDLRYSFHMSKMACFRDWYFIHAFFCYSVFLTGLACMAVRLVPALHWTHAWFGRFYVISMLLATASAMLIHNDGLPMAVLVSFVWVLGGMAVGWWLIKLHEIKMEKTAMLVVDQQIAANDPDAWPLAQAIGRAKGKIARAKSFKNRMLSYKATHGVVMFLSWFNIAGRIMFSSIDGDFTCHTYPVYKPRNSNRYQTKGMELEGQPLKLLPLDDPEYQRLPWAQTGMLAWNLIAFFSPVIIGCIVGSIMSFVFAKIENPSSLTEPDETPKKTDNDAGVPLADMATGS